LHWQDFLTNGLIFVRFAGRRGPTTVKEESDVMEVILRKDVDELGLEGDIVDVAKGYARNFLIPQGMAVAASAQNIKAMEMHRKKIDARRVKATEEAERLRERVEGLEITISQKAGEEGKLYGSVTSMDIAAELEKQGIIIDRRKINLEKPLKTLGEFQVPVKIYPTVTGVITVWVVPEGEQAASV
jgi:large subunit ribosomal protein L9